MYHIYYGLYVLSDYSVRLYVIKRTILFVEHYRASESHISLRMQKIIVYINHTYHELWRSIPHR